MGEGGDEPMDETTAPSKPDILRSLAGGAVLGTALHYLFRIHLGHDTVVDLIGFAAIFAVLNVACAFVTGWLMERGWTPRQAHEAITIVGLVLVPIFLVYRQFGDQLWVSLPTLLILILLLGLFAAECEIVEWEKRQKPVLALTLAGIALCVGAHVLPPGEPVMRQLGMGGGDAAPVVRGMAAVITATFLVWVTVTVGGIPFLWLDYPAWKRRQDEEAPHPGIE